MCSTKVTEFDNVKFSESISSKSGVSREFLEIDSNNTFSKKRVLQKREFSYPFIRQ